MPISPSKTVSAATGIEGNDMNQQPLGALLVRRGLITEEQLAAALADQLATGAPLGQIVVSRGYAASAAVAQALATQHGGLLKTEYGFATGFDSGGPPKPFVPPPVTSGRGCRVTRPDAGREGCRRARARRGRRRRARAGPGSASRRGLVCDRTGSASRRGLVCDRRGGEASCRQRAPHGASLEPRAAPGERSSARSIARARACRREGANQFRD